jgi:hypothetical protein
MNDLPTPVQNANQSPVSTAGGGISSKEKETGGPTREASFRPVGIESELSPEVVSSGVKVQPTSIPIPPPVSQLGVNPAGQNIPPPPAAVTLPLSDDQIATGLKQSVWSSWRWLSEWCIRKLKQVHTGLKNIHGKLTRVRE